MAVLLRTGSVLTLPVVVTEVLQGAPDEETLEALAMDFSSLEWIPVGVETAIAAARIGFALRRIGRAVPPTDLVIAAGALSAEAELWHNDRHFETIATVAPLRGKRLKGRS